MSPVHRAHALPSDADSALERKLVRDVKRLKRGWEIKRETTAVRAGESVFFPDFKLVRGEREVLVEVVGYYTPEYLENKLRKLREAKLRNFIVCIDRSLSCDDGEVTADVVLRYERRVDAGALLDAAEGMGCA
jgi:predicted nuclease of restriction endonuclease-like RecB superfamily